MPRKLRDTSSTGVYHVMLRGNNKQSIFETSDDYVRFLLLLDQKRHPMDSDHSPMPPCCVFYAYCLMPNHVHLLIQEKNERISDIIKSISVAYTQYYNIKYEHSGHLFQGRFGSEPVNDWEYFVTLLRYIHQNPVAGGLVSRVSDYVWSSWTEYEKKPDCLYRFCSTDAVISKISMAELADLVNEPLPKTRRILDYNSETDIRVSDDAVRDFITNECNIKNPKEIQTYPKEYRDAVIKRIRDYGGSIRQISRITGIGENIVRKVK